jgi:hypothetical protein
MKDLKLKEEVLIRQQVLQVLLVRIPSKGAEMATRHLQKKEEKGFDEHLKRCYGAL